MRRIFSRLVLALSCLYLCPLPLHGSQDIPLPALEYFEDPQAKLKISDILAQNPAKSFQVSEKSTLNFGFTTSAYWLRFPLQNQNAQSLEYWLEIAYPILNDIEFHLVDAAGLVALSSRTGTQRPFHTRSIKSPHFVIPMQLEAKSRYTVYLRIRTRGSMEIPLKLWRPAQWIASNESHNMVQGVFFGALGVMIFYNTFIFFSVRNYSYLFYVGFVFSYMSFQALMKGYAFQYIFPNHQHIISWALPLSIGLSCLFSTGFALSFLKFYQIKSRFTVLLRASGFFFIFCILAIPITSYRLIVTTLSVAATLSCILMLAAGINRVMSGKKEARFYVLAWAVYTVGGVLFGLSKLGLIGSNFLTSNAQQIGSLVEVMLISLALADRLNTLRRENKLYADHLAQANSNLAKANDQLKDYVGKIEDLVAIKTRNIKSIFATIRAGIFTVGADLRIEPEYSPYLLEIIGKPISDTTEPITFLFEDSDIRQDVQSAVRSTLIGALGEPLFAWEVNVEQLPKEFTVVKGASTSVLTCEFSPILRDDRVERVLIVVRDITEIRKLETESKERKMELELLGQLSRIDANKFRMLIHSVQQWIRAAPALLLAKSDEEKAQAIQIIFIHMHTLKGNARSLSLTHLAEAAHIAEHYLTEVRAKLDLWNAASLRALLQNIGAIVDNCEFVFTRRLGRSTDATLQLETGAAQDALASLSPSHWETIASITPLKKLVAMVSRHFWRDADEFLADLTQDAARLAQDLGKEPPQIMIEGGSLKLPTQAQDFFFHIMTHLLRNALDHGLEPAAERQKVGKSPAGTIFIRMRPFQDQVLVSFYDNGRGIDLDRVLRLAQQKNLVDPLHSPTPEEIAAFILLPGFSTRNSISTVSGRGVGLDAVCRSIQEQGGSIHLRLGAEVIEGCRSLAFDISLPASLFKNSVSGHLSLAGGFA